MNRRNLSLITTWTRRRPRRSIGWWGVIHLIVHVGLEGEKFVSGFNICFLEGEVILCGGGVSFVCGLSVTICLLVIFWLFLGVADDFVGELLRVLLFMFPPDLLLGVSSRVLEPVDVVLTEGSLEASRRDGCGPIQNAGVWHWNCFRGRSGNARSDCVSVRGRCRGWWRRRLLKESSRLTVRDLFLCFHSLDLFFKDPNGTCLWRRVMVLFTVYTAERVRRALISLMAFASSVSPACRKRRLKRRRYIAIVADTT